MYRYKWKKKKTSTKLANVNFFCNNRALQRKFSYNWTIVVSNSKAHYCVYDIEIYLLSNPHYQCPSRTTNHVLHRLKNFVWTGKKECSNPPNYHCSLNNFFKQVEKNIKSLILILGKKDEYFIKFIEWICNLYVFFTFSNKLQILTVLVFTSFTPNIGGTATRRCVFYIT